MQLRSIPCPIGFSDLLRCRVSYALSLAGYYKAKLVALHVVELWKCPFADYEADFARFSRAIKKGGEQRLGKFVKRHAAGEIQLELMVLQANVGLPSLVAAEKMPKPW